jgi:hypothetical protein
VDRKLVDQWVETERLLQAVLAEVRTQIDPEQQAWVLEYLEHNQLELAHDTLAEAIRNRDLTLGAEGRAALNAAHSLMQIKIDRERATR